MKKDKRQARAIIALLLVIVIISGLGMYAWARYQTTINGSADAQIAKWSFKVTDGTNETVAINLADTLEEKTEVEKVVASGKIAPGTKGAFELNLDGRGSEVGIDYCVTIDVSQKPTNLIFYTDSARQNKETLYDGKIVRDGSILLENINTPAKEKIYWEWPFETKTKTTQITAREDETTMVGELENVANMNGITVSGTAQEILETLNTAAGDDEVRIIEINDAIDTAECGLEISMPIKITAEQISTTEQEFTYRGVQIASEGATYVEGQDIVLEAVFNENVYAGTGKEAITAENAPVLTIEFENTTTAQNKIIAEVATITNSNIKLAEVNTTTRTATFDGASENKIRYKYKVTEGDKGRITKVSFSGNSVYNKRGKALSLNGVESEITGGNVQVETEAFAQGSTVITSDTNKTYAANDTITFEVNFNKNVYGGVREVALTAENAPVLTIGFSDNSSVTRTATFAGAEGSKIRYTYTVVEEDNGQVSIEGYTGNVYSKFGKELAVINKGIEGTVITVKNPVKIGTLQVGDYVDIGNKLLNDDERMYIEGGNRAEWRVAKVDETSGKVTLILSDFLPTSNITNELSMGMTLNSNGYTLGWSSNNSTTAVNSLTTSSNWTNLLTGSKLEGKGVTIKGALTKDDIPNSANRVSDTNNTFVSHSSTFSSCYGYWVASVRDSRDVWYVHYDGGFRACSCNYSLDLGVRPAVILDSNILVGNIGTNAYSIK